MEYSKQQALCYVCVQYAHLCVSVCHEKGHSEMLYLILQACSIVNFDCEHLISSEICLCVWEAKNTVTLKWNCLHSNEGIDLAFLRSSQLKFPNFQSVYQPLANHSPDSFTPLSEIQNHQTVIPRNFMQSRKFEPFCAKKKYQEFFHFWRNLRAI